MHDIVIHISKHTCYYKLLFMSAPPVHFTSASVKRALLLSETTTVTQISIRCTIHLRSVHFTDLGDVEAVGHHTEQRGQCANHQEELHRHVLLAYNITVMSTEVRTNDRQANQ